MQITSQVLSSEMLILPRANVVETVNGVETANRTIADDSGIFTINVSSPEAQLKISQVGYYYDTFTAGEINNKYVELYVDPQMLDEVNAVQSTKKSDHTLEWILGLALVAAVVKIASGGQSKPKPLPVKP